MKTSAKARHLKGDVKRAWPRGDSISSRLAGLDADRATGAFLFFLTSIIFLALPLPHLADSKYSTLLSQSLVQRRTFNLDAYKIPDLAPTQTYNSASNTTVYQIEHAGGHFYHMFPPGSAVLSAPYVALLNLFRISASNPDGSYNSHGEKVIQASLASLLMGALTAIFFFTSRLLLPLDWSVWIALGGALGTQVWSTASRAMWSDTWGIFLLGYVILLLLSDATGRRPFRPVWLATLLAWMYFVRPTYSIPITAITIYVLIYRRNLFVPFALTGAAWFAAFVAYSYFHFGQPLPFYYRASRLKFDSFSIAFAGNLISPSRGLLTHVPALFFVAYLLLRYARELPHARLACVALGVIVLHLLVIAGFTPWWGGHSFGPRYTTGLVPWFVLLATLGVKAMLMWREKHAEAGGSLGWRATLYAGAVLLVLSVLINGRGGITPDTLRWNVYPQNIDEHPERVWDWRHPQVLAYGIGEEKH
ncbi:MAG TPA: hypothetical protein VJ842_03290 [Pyrinomonadaceae bacterium]|nr:hypothetical protein [Pyrinomonadaceae bacterium]